MRTSLRTIAVIAALLSSVPAWAQESLTITKVYTPAATDLTLAPTSDVVLNPTGKDVLPGLGYDVNLGMLTKKYLALHAAELWVETLVAQNTMATIGGRVLVSPTTSFVQDVGTGDTTIHVKHNQMVSGDRAYSEANAAVEFFAITSSASSHSGHFDYTVTRNLDGSGANAWTAGDALLNTGQTGNGFIDLYSVRGVKAGTEIGPTIVGNVRLSSTYNDWAPRWAIGQLNGLYGYSSSTYGSAFGVPSGARVTMDATNGIRLYDGLNNLRISLTTGGSATFSGDGDDITNIDGGNIQTETITATQIAANSISAGQINATGFGDNVIKNGAFEGVNSAQGLSGWAKDANSTSSAAIVNSCCGKNGPGTLLLDPTNGFYMSAGYRAFPVVPGQTYRVSAKVFAASTSAAALTVMVYENNTTTAGVQRVVFSGATSGQVNQTSTTFLCNACAVTSGWNSAEYTYTVPAGIYWAALVVYDVSGTVSGSTYTLLHFDDIEMQKQIGPGHIIANSITADRLSVGTLDAISANLGTITAGSMTGVTATFGGAVTLDSGGISLAYGSGSVNQIKWGSGAGNIFTLGDGQMTINADAQIYLNSGGGAHIQAEDPVDVLGALLVTGGVRLSALGGSGSTAFVCTNNTGDLYSQGTTCDGSTPLQARVAELEAQLAEMRAELARVLAAVAEVNAVKEKQ